MQKYWSELYKWACIERSCGRAGLAGQCKIGRKVILWCKNNKWSYTNKHAFKSSSAGLGEICVKRYIPTKSSVCKHSFCEINSVFENKSGCTAIAKIENDAMTSNVVIFAYSNVITKGEYGNE